MIMEGSLQANEAGARRDLYGIERGLDALSADIRRIARRRVELGIQLSEIEKDRQRLMRHHALMVRELEGKEGEILG